MQEREGFFLSGKSLRIIVALFREPLQPFSIYLQGFTSPVPSQPTPHQGLYYKEPTLRKGTNIIARK